MTQEQLAGMLDVLPMELAFIDADDKVRFWNRTEGRGPGWQPSALGKPAQACHQDSSVPAVNSILHKLKNRARDVVERKVTSNGEEKRFRWYAVRDANGRYLGTVEVIQYGTEIAQDSEHG